MRLNNLKCHNNKKKKNYSVRTTKQKARKDNFR